MRVYSNNLLPCIIFHTIVNGFQSAGLIAEPYIRQAVGMAETAATFVPLLK
jgi:hypothetical protein